MTNSTPEGGLRIGDRVTVAGEITNSADGGVYVSLDKSAISYFFKEDELTFVERPEKKYKVVLTESQLKWLIAATDAKWGIGDYVNGTFTALDEAEEI